MKAKYFLIAFVLIWKTVYPQKQGHLDSRRLVISYSAATSYSFFSYNEKSIGNRFPVPELKLGGLVEKGFTQFSIKTGVQIGVKLKSKQYYDPFAITSQHPLMLPMRDIDKTMSSRNHYFIEIPAMLQYRLKKIKVGSGISGRYYIPNSQPGQADFVSGHFEAGSITNLTYQLTEKLVVGIQGYSALTPLFKGFSYNVDGNLLPEVKARNNYIGLGLEYRVQ